MEKEFIKVSELAKRFDVVPETIYRLIREGKLPCHQIGRAKRIRLTDVEEYLKRTRK